MARVAALGCIICRRLGMGPQSAEVHHIRTGIGAGRKARDDQTIPLCPAHHRGAQGLHGLGRKRFEREYGVTELALLGQTLRELGIPQP